MKTRTLLLITIFIVISLGAGLILVLKNSRSAELDREISKYSGSESCKPCHERFYELWAHSWHGLAMQAVSPDFVRSNIKAFEEKIQVGSSQFEVFFINDTLRFSETERSGIVTTYPAIHTMGGKYIYYFLTPLEKGRLQVLPLAYDCKTDEWYNNPESGVRHFETIDDDSALDWKSHLYTFNTTCYNCHVSQLETNFDLAENKYDTQWREPGINCETCHKGSREHIEVCVKAGEGNVPEDLKIVMTSKYTPEQHNSACLSCHAKSAVIATAFEPEARFFDYFDLTTLENPDFYADGRDLGENYTMTTWQMNKCVQNSDMHCVTCHTSSGRYRFAGENANDACMQCHSDKTSDISAHTFHLADGPAGECIACHMPKTIFARMERSDHSFRPPMPEATIAFGSPNACNICHDDKTPEWANEHIRRTHNRDYQSEPVKNGMLIRQARANDWTNIEEITTGLTEGRFDEVYSTSFIRLMGTCDMEIKWPAILEMCNHQSPLVRSAAAHSLSAMNTQDVFEKLLSMINDDYRLVRLNAAYALSAFPANYLQGEHNVEIQEAMKEYEQSLITRIDDWSSHYNLGNYYSNTGALDEALNSFLVSIELFPEAIMPMVNAGFIYSIMGRFDEAESMFLRALSYMPDHEAALLNLALLYGETGKIEKAKQHYRRLLQVSEKNAVAAYNLAVLVSADDISESVILSKKAMQWGEDNPKYKYTYAFFINQSGKDKEAISILNELIADMPAFIDSYFLVSSILAQQGENDKARIILNRAIENPSFSDEQKQSILIHIKQLQ